MQCRNEVNLKATLKEQIEEERIKYPLFYGEILLNDKQEEFLYCGELENGIIVPARIRGFSAGNRSGKSSSGYLEDFAWCLGYRPWLTPDHPNYLTPFKPPIKLLLCTESFSSTAKDALWRDIQELIPPRFIIWSKLERMRNPTKTVIGIPLINESFIRIMSYDQSTKNFESSKNHCIHYDEPPPQDKFIASQRSLVDTHGFTWITFTNLREPWLKRDIVDRHDGKKIHIVKGKIWDNEIRYVNGKQKGGLTKEGIINFLDKIKDPKIRKVRETGEAEHFAGPVYRFDDKHIIENPAEHPVFKNTGGKIPKYWTRGMVVDPHEGKPYAIAYYAISPEPNPKIYIYDEYPNDYFHEMASDNKNIQQIAELMKSKEWEQEIFVRYLDKVYYNKPSMTTKLTLAEEFAQYDICFYPTEEINIHTTIQLLQNLLYYDDTKAIDSINSPKLYVFGNCINMIWGLMNFYWKDTSGIDKDDLNDSPSKKHKCFADLAGYIAVSDPLSYAPKQKTEQMRAYYPEKSQRLRSMVRQKNHIFKSRSRMYAKN